MNVINAFPGYEFKDGKNIYRNTNIGRGGYIISNAGIYENVALLDVGGMHPASIVSMNCFGDYTQHFKDIRDARIAIKHGDFDTARKMLSGRLAPYLDDETTAKELAQALKIAVNSVYGLTAANFDNPFRDVRNKNNIVALKGALFMRTLQDEIESKGYQIVAIKTDSIKIVNATKEIIEFCMDFAKQYGYEFEFEAAYSRICQVNDADYVARYADSDWCEQTFGFIPSDNKKHSGKWTVTGSKFAVPYVFKTLFSKEPIEFDDLCETKEVKRSSLYLDMNENLPDVSEHEKELDKLRKKSDYQPGGEREVKLKEEISKGHSYIFVGRIGRFCPIKPGCGGGVLLCETVDPNTGEKKYSSASGAKGYRWLESEMVKELGKEDDIDKNYYRGLVDEAVAEISKYGDFESFVSEDLNPVTNDEPPWFNPDEPYIDELVHTPFDVR